MNSPIKRAYSGLVLCIGLATLPLPREVYSADAAPAAGIEITDAVSHPSAGAAVGVIYLRVVNHSKRNDRLIGASTPAAAAVMLHETTVDGDMVRMRHRPKGFEIKAGSEITLESGGKHIMLTGLKVPLENGESIDLELIFEHADKVRIRVPIRPRAS